MSRISGKGTKPEIILRKALFAKGFRYRVNVGNLPGKPDIVLPKYKSVIFVHGCFWHGHSGCKHAYVPKSNTEFWINKIEKLIAAGWRVITVWECEIRRMKNIDFLIERITAQLL